jgi:hypothetical protein
LADPVLFTANGGVVWQSVTFSSNFNSFEFANVSTLPASVSAIPEPSSIALLAVGFLAMGVGVRSRSRSIV